MKKKTKIIIGAVLFIMAVLVGSTYFVIKSFNDKEPISLEEFRQIAETNGYEYEEDTSEAVRRFGELGIIGLDEEVYASLTVLNYERDSIGIYSVTKNSMEEEKTNNSSETSITTEHYEKYTLVSKGIYNVCIRVGNTILTLTGPETKREVIDDFIKSIGY